MHIMSGELLPQPYTVLSDAVSVWQQGNMLAGDTYIGTNPEGWEQNLETALANLAKFTTASRVLRLSAAGQTVDLIDMDRAPQPSTLLQPLRTEGVITSNPAHVLFANPADCGEIAVSGVANDDRPVIGLFHASRQQVDRKSYLRSLEYLCVSRGIEVEDLSLRLSPSARAESYVFRDIDDAQRTSSRWEGYVKYCGGDGLWRVDFHNLMRDDLRAFGIKDEQVWVSPDDTAHPDSPYFSYSQSVSKLVKHNKPDGGNGLLLALRS